MCSFAVSALISRPPFFSANIIGLSASYSLHPLGFLQVSLWVCVMLGSPWVSGLHPPHRPPHPNPLTCRKQPHVLPMGVDGVWGGDAAGLFPIEVSCSPLHPSPEGLAGHPCCPVAFLGSTNCPGMSFKTGVCAGGRALQLSHGIPRLPARLPLVLF